MPLPSEDPLRGGAGPGCTFSGSEMTSRNDGFVRARWRAAPVLVAALLLNGARLTGADAETASMPSPTEVAPEHRDWLERVRLLILPHEQEYFLSLQEPFRREAFIAAFWKARDPDVETARNEFRRSWDRRIDTALARYGSVTDARAVLYLLNGEPGRYLLPNGRTVERCYRKRERVEVWFYGGSLRTDKKFVAILYQPEFPPDSEYRLWLARETMVPAKRRQLPVTDPSLLCDDHSYGWALRSIEELGWTHYRSFMEDLTAPPVPSSREWVDTFHARTTLLPPGMDTFQSELAVDFPTRNQNRVAVRGVVTIPSDAVSGFEVEGGLRHEFLMTGEVVRDNRLFESFRYRFEMPAGSSDADIPLVFQRYLRAGPARLLLKIEDLFGRKFTTFDRVVEVPVAEALASARPMPDAELFRRLEEARQAAERGQTTIRVLPPVDEGVRVGVLRIHTVSSGEFDKVIFYLDGRPLMTKRTPPFSVEVNLGEVAASHRVRVEAFDATGSAVASDELIVNQGGQRFRVRLIEPRADRSYESSLSAVVRVEVPDGQTLDRVEIFLGERRVATLFQEPFVQPVLLERRGMSYVRAVGYLEDGNATEDVVFVNAPEYFERLDVQLVELFATVVDGGGQAILDLGAEDFRVLEDGEPQQMRRFEYVRDLPIHAMLLVDTSASMEESLPRVAAAAGGFLEQAIEPRDRVALTAFDSRPRVEVRFTNDSRELSAALAGLRAGGGTAIYDSLVFALHYFDGVKGPKALLLLSDGKDEASHFDLEGTLAVAQRVGVTVYVIGLRELARDKIAKRLLRRVARETGGTSYFIEDLDELEEIYRAIQDDLRSQYFIAYQSTSDKDPSELRLVRIEVDRRGAEVRAMSGYYP